MLNDIIFKSKVALTLKNKKAEADFNSYINEQRTKYNKLFSGFLFLASLGDLIFQNIINYKIKENIPIDISNLRLYTAFVVTSLSFFIFILGLFIQKHIFQIFISYANFILIVFPFSNIRGILLLGGYAREEVVGILRTVEILIMVIMIMLFLVPFPHGIIMNLILIALMITFQCLIRNYYFIFYYFVCVAVYILISYFYTKNLKEKIMTEHLLKNQMNWYFNLFEHLHSGYISFRNCLKINIMNNTLYETLCKNKEIYKILKEENAEEELNILPTTQYEESINMKILKNKSEKVLNILLKNIYKDFKDNKDNNNNISNSNFDLRKFLNEHNSLYVNKEMFEKFLFIGYTDFEVETCSISNENNNINLEKKTENITFEIYYRCRDGCSTDTCEILFYDVSNTKKMEEKNAELKYKTIFLSKVAHEFKNPLICMKELVNEFDENYSEEIKTSSNIKLRESYKLLKQISSFADYLLILMKDLDLFARLQIQQEVPITFNRVDNYEIFDSIKELAELLLFKFNKKNNVKFISDNRIPDNVDLITDGIKLKQILINLISNAIKFTNLGVIKLKAEKIDNENLIKLEVSDTGIGLTNDQLQNLFQPFKMVSGGETKYGSGLGLFIVSNIIKQLNSEILVSSKVGEGTIISFCLPCQLKENIDGESKKTIQLPEDENSMMIDISEIPNNEEVNIWIKPKSKRGKTLSITSELKIDFEPLPQPETKLQLEILNKEEPLPPPQSDYSYFICVDDEHFTRKSSIRILNKAAEKLNKKIAIFDAADGIECLYLIYKLIKNGYRIAAIVCDEFMNHMNGTLAAEVLKKVKNLNTDKIPFYLLTAYPDIKNYYVNQILTKPLNLKEAENIINSIIQN